MSETPAEMPIPKHRRAVLAAVLLTAFIAFFAALAVKNLFVERDWCPLIGSSLWLLLIAFVFYAGLKVEGRQSLINMLGAFSAREFVQSVPREAGPAEIRFGFDLFGLRFFYLCIPVDKIETVEWHTGQGSYFAGRDIGDWHIGVWYVHGDPARSAAQQGLAKPDQEVYCPGESAAKEKTAALGSELIRFLERAGARFIPGKDESTFTRASDQ